MELQQPLLITNPLTVASKAGKHRLELDLRYVNDKLHVPQCKVEGAETFLKMLRPDDYIITFDLKSGFHHVEISKQHTDLLGFSFTDDANTQRFFKFKVMPFGLATATLVFTKLIRQLVKAWRAQGISVVVFVEDGIVSASSASVLAEYAKIIQKDLIAAGWVPHRDKSHWIPQKSATWLGMEYDTTNNVVRATPEKVMSTHSLIQNIYACSWVHVRTLAKLVGKLISMHIAFGDIIYLRSKCMQCQIASTQSWSSNIHISDLAKREMLFWQNYLFTGNGMSLHTPAGAAAISFSDASATGVGAILSPKPGSSDISIHRVLSPEEQLASSTRRELIAIDYALDQSKELLSGKILHWFTDSANVTSIIKKGSMKPDLLDLALHIFEIAKRHQICLTVSWIPRNNNTRANMLSRIIDHDDWIVSDSWYKYITDNTSIPNFDRFASELNAKTPLYNSRFFYGSSQAVDAFTQSWDNYTNWIVPPVHLITRVLDYLEQVQADSICVFPAWKSSYFWPRILTFISSHKHSIARYYILPNVFAPGQTPSSIFGDQHYTGNSMVIWIKKYGYSQNSWQFKLIYS